MRDTKRIIYLDMDGVLVDFTHSAFDLCEVNGQAVQHLYETWPAGKMVTDLVGLDEDKFWDRVNQKGPDWWAKLRKYPWSEQLVRLCNQLAKTMILSSPSRGGHSAAGKLVWIEKNFTNMRREFVLTPKKHKPKLARPGDVLIDDTAKTCSAWHNAGGDSILFPRPWNNHPDWRDPMAAVTRQLNDLGFPV